MPRTSVSDVTETFDTDLSEPKVSSWIDVAHEIVNDIEQEDPTIRDSKLEKIEMLVAQHLMSAQDQRIESTSIESFSVTYQGEYGEFFRSTDYGQNAILLDPTGTLTDSQKGDADFQVFSSR